MHDAGNSRFACVLESERGCETAGSTVDRAGLFAEGGVRALFFFWLMLKSEVLRIFFI